MSEKNVRRMFKAYGFTVQAIRRNRHWCVKASLGSGRTFHFTIAGSPGRSQIKKIEADIKRATRCQPGTQEGRR